MRPAADWTDRVYTVLADVAHLKPFGDPWALCGLDEPDWRGTGDMDEIDTADTLPLCAPCQRALRPKNWKEISASA